MWTWARPLMARLTESPPGQTVATQFHLLPRRKRWTGWLIAFALLSPCCSRKPTPIEAVDSLDAAGKAPEALKRADSELAHTSASDAVYWELSLRKVRLLDELKAHEDALALLGSLDQHQGASADIRSLL